MPSYLLSTPHGYYFRLKIPHDLRIHFKKNELKKTLNTNDLRVAKKLAAKYALRAHEIFEVLRGPTVANLPYTNTVNLLLGIMQSVGQTPNCQTAQAIAISDVLNPPPPFNTNLPIISAILPKSVPYFSSSPVISEAVEKYEAEKLATQSGKAQYFKDQRLLFKLLTEVIGDKNVDEVTYDDAMLFLQTLKHLPTHRSKDPKYRGKSITAILKMKHTATLSEKTINLHMVKVSGFFKWMQKVGLVEKNHFQGLTVRVNTPPRQQRNAFSVEELKMMFSNELFTQRKFKHSYMFWLPVIGLYTGMRLNEICQLHKDDILKKDNIWIIRILDDTDDKSTKNTASRRDVPIHSKLLGLGILKFRDKVKNERLFPELPFFRGRHSHTASNWFVRFRQKIKLNNKGKDFHSFRHTVSDHLMKQLVPEELTAAILGHSTTGITYGRYGKGYHLSTLRDVVEKLEFDDVISNIKPW